MQAIERAGYRPGKDVYLGLDVASSEFFRDGKYEFAAEHRSFSSPNSAITWPTWRPATRSSASRMAWRVGLGRLVAPDGRTRRKLQLVGDDLFVTNTKILAEGISRGIANAILIKPNQIGTLTETLAAIDMADQAQLRRGGLAPLRRDGGLHHR